MYVTWAVAYDCVFQDLKNDFTRLFLIEEVCALAINRQTITISQPKKAAALNSHETKELQADSWE